MYKKRSQILQHLERNHVLFEVKESKGNKVSQSIREMRLWRTIARRGISALSSLSFTSVDEREIGVGRKNTL